MNRPVAPDQDKMDSPADEALLIRYLIGDCAEDERTRVEERFFAETDTFDRLCELEEELAARYARGELRADERAQFERTYSAPPRRDRLILNLALGRIFASTPASGPKAASIATPSWRRWLTFEPAAARWALAAATVVLLTGVLVQFRQAERLRTSLGQSQQNAAALRARLDQAERRAADAERRNAASEPSAQTASPVIATFVLTPGLTRNARGPARVGVPPGATALRFQLTLDFDGGYNTLSADLRTAAGTSVWTQAGLKPQKTTDGSAVMVTIPAATLANGEYELLLQGVLKGNSVEDAATYHFTVDR
jgi:hypothetical protein